MIRRFRLHIFWSHLLRLLMRDRHVPLDVELRARYGTWGWLTGKGMWKPTAEDRERVRRAESASPDIPSSRHPDMPPSPPAATTGPRRNAPTPTSNPPERGTVNRPDAIQQPANIARARLLHPTPAELVASNAQSDTLCTTCISPAPCPTRRALDGQE